MFKPGELRSLYMQGNNITRLLREEHGLDHNTDEIIEIAYDLQAGTYVAAMEDPQMAAYNQDYTSEIARTISSLDKPMTILEAGVGEATTLAGVVKNLGRDVRSFGFDLSWSRVAHAKRWLQKQGVDGAILCTGNLFNIPFADNSIDVVYTSHSIEPNGGNEEPILKELFRVTRRYLILLEPSYELANDEAKARMDCHGYCKNLNGLAHALGYNVLKHSLFPYISNPLNPTALTIIEKYDNIVPPLHTLACPRFKTSLKEIDNMLFSPEALAVYPIIGGIPCLRIENSIFASQYEEFMGIG